MRISNSLNFFHYLNLSCDIFFFGCCRACHSEYFIYYVFFFSPRCISYIFPVQFVAMTCLIFPCGGMWQLYLSRKIWTLQRLSNPTFFSDFNYNTTVISFSVIENCLRIIDSNVNVCFRCNLSKTSEI